MKGTGTTGGGFGLTNRYTAGRVFPKTLAVTSCERKHVPALVSCLTDANVISTLT
jgi:hypothetical protein